ncbi:cobalt ECF transporter T component CbiQ [Caldimonas thermodepolymerans]|jgi:ABC-type cobalt transport system, permease component CbiQ and related transporters|uniref:Cobalt ECF transporter T component CbiQ n=1 Tax=Caldimonas thermodepolymerans TaxID=215580 RepID=A0A2S5T534_9BURK|nr:energy-coupling factor transporter transmembrane component T [Caldimonas thermodepolymerans]PPE70093.1 cobalt ECF transporter T component CbiQ [Caldimonas thermodepolymerans]QPC31840.1 cobalt ECF transporter T component CbiQ [Caldimonas thermodepolymerans]RDI01653.1 cobalt/nickel transport system permease protein [Caldimonas thermodepolymerans]TCP05790.1 cobalt/nickel transport system permease protein [Caldimonas thermodepolymerans]UZG44624.1 energy-coupling factor transporter transmembrane
MSRAAAFLHRLDPRVRLLALLAASLWTARAPGVPALAGACALAALLALAAPLERRRLRRAALALNGFLLVAAVTLPFSVAGAPLWQLGGWSASAEGVQRAAVVVLTGNTLMLLFAALVAPVEPATLAHALLHLKVPDKLVRLLMFALRYVGVLHETRLRLARAMRARGHRPRLDRHTLRSAGYLVAALVGHSVERARRIEMAMRCRGWQGKFPVLHHFRAGWRDAAFAAGFAAALALLEWGAP